MKIALKLLIFILITIPTSIQAQESISTSFSTTQETNYKLQFDGKWWENATPQDVETLVKNGININEKNEKEMTALIYAASKNNNPEVIETLIKNGANVNAKNENGITALTYAALLNSNPEIIKTLLKHGANFNPLDNENIVLDILSIIDYEYNFYDIDKLKQIEANIETNIPLIQNFIHNGEYPKLLEKYKQNILEDQISTLVSNIRTLYGNYSNYAGLNSESAINIGAVDVEMQVIPGTASAGIKHVFSDVESIFITTDANNPPSSFFITIQKLPPAACTYIASYDFGHASSYAWKGVHAEPGDFAAPTSLPTTVDSKITKTGTSLPMTFSDAKSSCTGSSNTVVLWFK